MKRIFKDYGLSVALLILFLLAWALQAVTGWVEFAHEQASHGEPAEIGAYLWSFARATFENWQSEWLQLLTFVVLTAYLIHRGSHESRDSSDRQEAKIDELLKRVKGLEDKGG